MSQATTERLIPGDSPWTDRALAWLGRNLYTQLTGVSFGDWWQLLRENRFAVDRAYLPKAAILTALSLSTSLGRRRENRRFGRDLADVEIRPPLFVLGHWRSGTTHLHNLIALDDRFAYPNLLQVTRPHTFLLAKSRHYEAFDRALPRTRRFDNVEIKAGFPAEDEFATCAMSLRSPYMWAFPRNEERYARYLTFRGVPEAEIARWKESMVCFLRKLTLLYDRPLALKSPPHTCRIKLLLDLFPDARFVHIRRDPFAVFRSTMHMESMLFSRPQFQNVFRGDLETMILKRYTTMYDLYFEERELIPDGQLHELSIEDLEHDPTGQMRLMYQTLGLADFERVESRLEEYIAARSDYRKNEFTPMHPVLRTKIASAWHRCFEMWDYPRI